VNELAISWSPSVDLLLFHEASTASGVIDENYSFTLSLFLMDQITNPDSPIVFQEPELMFNLAKENVEASKRRTKNPVYQLAGGSSGVGSGGEAIGIS